MNEHSARWRTVPIKRFATPGAFTDGDWIESPFITDSGVRLLQTGNVGIGRFKEQGFRYISEESFTALRCTEVRPGDVLICRLADPVGRACLAPDLGVKMITSVDVAILRPTAHYDARFIVYALSSAPYLGYLESICRGGTRDRVSRSMLGDVPVTVPPLPRQRAIADVLDHKTAAVDALIEKKERLLALTEERRQATIYTLVTKGVGPVARTRESGHDWIGAIPANWDVARTRHVARLESGHTPSRQHPEYWVPEECTIPWVSLADVWQIREGRVDVIRETAEKVSPLGIANSAARVLPAGTVIVSRTASVGFSALIAEPMATTQDFVNWICGPRLRPKYLLYVFRAMRDEFRRLTMGSTHQTIYMPDVARFVTPVPLRKWFFPPWGLRLPPGFPTPGLGNVARSGRDPFHHVMPEDRISTLVFNED